MQSANLSLLNVMVHHLNLSLLNAVVLQLNLSTKSQSNSEGNVILQHTRGCGHQKIVHYLITNTGLNVTEAEREIVITTEVEVEVQEGVITTCTKISINTCNFCLG